MMVSLAIIPPLRGGSERSEGEGLHLADFTPYGDRYRAFFECNPSPVLWTDPPLRGGIGAAPLKSRGATRCA